MDEKPQTNSVKPRYTLVSVEKPDPLPSWLPDGNWHRYTIRQGSSDLEGYKAGSLKTVTRYAELVAEELNNRGTNSQYASTRSKGKSNTGKK